MENTKTIGEFVKESIEQSLMDRINGLLRDSNLTDDDAYAVINILDKSGEETVRAYLSKYKLTDSLIEQIILSDRKGEISRCIVNSENLPTFSDFKNGNSIIDLFSKKGDFPGLSPAMVRRLFDITTRGGHGAVGKGEYLLNLFVRPDSEEQVSEIDLGSGDVHIGNNCIELKTTPNAHPAGRECYLFRKVIAGLVDTFGIPDDIAEAFFKVEKGKGIVNDAIRDHIISNYGVESFKDKKTLDIVFRQIFDCIVSQFDMPKNETDKLFRSLKTQDYIKLSGKDSVNLDIQKLINLTGAVQTKFYIDELVESNCQWICIIAERSQDMHYVFRSCKELNDLNKIMSVITKFTNSMTIANNDPQSNTMKIAEISK